MELNDLMKLINENVLKYIDNYDVDGLVRYISGFMFKKSLINKTKTESEQYFMESFPTWVREYYGEEQFNTGDIGYILLHCNGCHKCAVEKYFELYQIWYKEKFNKEAW